MQKQLQNVLNSDEDNYILPFYWQHGEDGALVAQGMDKIRESNIKAVCVEARPHPDFAGPQWWKDMDIIMGKAKELGMKVWVLDDSHFPTGRCNDLVTPDCPYRKFVLTHYTIDLVGPMKNASFIVSLDKNETFIGAVASRIHKDRPYYQSEVKDITEFRRGTVIEWDVPEGFWSITVIKTTDKHTARQGYANLIDRDAVRFFLDTVYEPHYAHYGKDFGTVFAGFFSDEPELGNTFKDIPNTGDSYAGNPSIPLPWCKELEEELHKLWGSEYCKNLSTLWYTVDDDPEKTNKSGEIRKEYTELVTKLYQKNFGEQVGDWCRAHGVEYIGHIIEGCRFGPGVGHYFRGLWGQDMSGVDIVLQQLRPQMDDISYHRIGGINANRSEMAHYGIGKLASSLAHIDPKKKGRALCENFGAYGWAEGVKLMKWLTDHMLVRGINYYVPHGFTMKDFPDPDCPPHFFARGNNPQFPYFGLLMQYINRVSHLISNGVHCTDTGILYSSDLEWMERDTMQFVVPAMILTQNQVDFDILPIDVVTESRMENNCLYTGAPVYEGGLLVGQEHIKTLIIPECHYFDAKFATWCKKVMKEGLEIICINHLPKILNVDGSLSEWGEDCPIVVALDDLAQDLKNKNRGLQVSKTEDYLRYYHYKHRDGAYYLFFNESVVDEIAIDVKLLAQEDDEAVVYDAWNNCLTKADWNKREQILSLKLQPYEMKIVCLGSFEQQTIKNGLILDGEPIAFQPEWKLSLRQTKELEYSRETLGTTLFNVTAYDKYPEFCGNMKYEAELICNSIDEFVAIDFGEVYETAQLFINKKEVGVKITPPYRFDLGGYLTKGKNSIELIVTNTVVHQIHDRFSMTMPVEPSGVLGPVTLIMKE